MSGAKLSKSTQAAERLRWSGDRPASSPTAERIFSQTPEIAVRSGGTSPKARRQVNQSDIVCADVIFVMEDKHKSRLAAGFRRAMQCKTVHVLDIPDDYGFMDPDLVEIFEQSVPPLLR